MSSLRVLLLQAIRQDLRYSIRSLRRDAALSTFAVLIVAFGVGASSTVFSLFDALLIRPLPFDDPDRLVWIANGTSSNLSAQTVQVQNLQDFQSQNRSFSDVAGYSPFYGVGDIRLIGIGEPERLTGIPVSGNFFRMLGVQPQIGRLFTTEECRWGAPRTALLNYGFWQRRFASNPDIVGRPITLDDTPVTVVGVLPASFDFAGMFAPGSRIDLFLPFPLSPETDRQGNTLALIGRLKPGVSLQRAQVEANLIGQRIEGERNAGIDGQERRRNGFHPNLCALRERVSGRFRYALLVLGGAVGFLMLLVCANLSNLLLARASARQKEMAIRVALGAGRRRLMQQMLIESLTLSACGAALGLAFAFTATRFLARIEGTSVPLLQEVRVNQAALGFTLLMAIVAAILFGLMPALQVSAPTPNRALKESSRGAIGGAKHGMRRSLVVCEIALACLLLTGAGLMMRSLFRVLDVDMGFVAENLLVLRIDPGRAYSTLAQKTSYFDEVIRRVSSVPGVDAAGLTDALPLGQNYGWRTWILQAKGQVYERGQVPVALVRVVDDGYLGTMKILLRAGRGFTPADNATAEPVIILNEKLASTLWPGENPLGRVIKTSGGNSERRVVGIVRGVRYFGLEQDPGAEMYLPMRQTRDYHVVDLVVRASRSPTELAPRLRATLRSVDPNFPATEFRTMRQLVDSSVFTRRSVVSLLGGFALFALVLASLGIYGVISYSVNQRKQEIGIRMALGASAGIVVGRIVMQTGKLALVGMILGVAASWMVARALQGLLFGLRYSDPATFAGVLAILAAVAALAGYIPARRATRSNPLDALRSE